MHTVVQQNPILVLPHQLTDSEGAINIIIRVRGSLQRERDIIAFVWIVKEGVVENTPSPVTPGSIDGMVNVGKGCESKTKDALSAILKRRVPSGGDIKKSLSRNRDPEVVYSGQDRDLRKSCALTQRIRPLPH